MIYEIRRVTDLNLIFLNVHEFRITCGDPAFPILQIENKRCVATLFFYLKELDKAGFTNSFK